MPGLVTVAPLFKGDMVGGLAWGHGVTDGHQALLSHPECAGGRNVSVCSLCKQSCVFMYTQRAR